MPIIRDTPKPVGAPIVVDEIVGFSADLVHGVLTIAIDAVDADGKVITQEPKKSKLFNPDGSPRFTAEERAVFKGALYRIGIADGHLPAGTIV